MAEAAERQLGLADVDNHNKKKKIDEQLRYSDQELLVKLNTKTNIRTSDIMLRKATPEAKDNVITSLFMIVSDVVVWHYYSNLLYYFSSNPFLRYQVILERNLITCTQCCHQCMREEPAVDRSDV